MVELDVLNPADIDIVAAGLVDGSAGVRAATFEALSRLPLTASDWRAVGRYAVRVLADDESSAERLAVIDASPSIPLRSVRDRVAELVDSAEPGLRRRANEAVRAMGHPRAVPTILALPLGDPNLYRIARADISGSVAEVRAEFGARPAGSEDAFWLALALALFEEDAELRAVVELLAQSQLPDWYRRADNRLAKVMAARRLPESTARWLNEPAAPIQRDLVSALTVPPDLTSHYSHRAGTPLQPGWSDGRNPGFSTRVDPDQSVAREVDELYAWISDSSTWVGRSQEMTEELAARVRSIESHPVIVSRLMERTTSASGGGHRSIFESNNIVKLVEMAQGRFRPDVAALFETYHDEMTRSWPKYQTARYDEASVIFAQDDDEGGPRSFCLQIGWIVSRGGLPGLVPVLAGHLRSADPAERIAAAYLIADAAAYVTEAIGPQFGGGSGPGREVAWELVDESDEDEAVGEPHPAGSIPALQDVIDSAPSRFATEGQVLAPAPSSRPPSGPPPSAPSAARPRWRLRDLVPRRLRRSGSSMGNAVRTEPPEVAAEALTEAAAEPTRAAYPMVDCNPVWVTDEPESVTIGLTPKMFAAVGSTGPVVGADEDEVDDLSVTLLVDPESIALATGAQRTHPLPVTSSNRFPTVRMQMTALSGTDLADERRIGLHFRRGGRSIGFAWRRVRVVDSRAEVATVASPSQAPDILDLAGLIDEKPPDLVLAIYRADDTAGTSYVWDAFSPSEAVAVPDTQRSSGIAPGDTADFATQTRRTISGTIKGVPLFAQIQGYGVDIARAIPSGIVEVVRAVATGARGTAASVLLLSEEASVPWELAVMREPRLETEFSTSPFLGAHVAISRWPLVSGKPRPTPRNDHEITAAAVLSAEYKDVEGWPRLKEAEAEAARVARTYAMTTLPPLWTVVRDTLEGRRRPPVDWVHVALHGQFDPQGDEDGLVLLDESPLHPVQQFLTTRQIQSFELPQRPFVFLNACQVGSGNRVLGSYAGMAVALLRGGATAVVAPQWNIDDDVAGEVADTFYRAVLGDAPVPVAEALRAIRSTYTEANVTADPSRFTPTLIAYQLFGHPRLTLHRVGGHGLAREKSHA